MSAQFTELVKKKAKEKWRVMFDSEAETYQLNGVFVLSFIAEVLEDAFPKKNEFVTCSKKVYTSKREANEVINAAKGHRYTGNQRQNRKREKIPVRAYYCNHCEGWHLTSIKTWNKEGHE